MTLFDTIDLQECAGHQVHIHMKEIVYISPLFLLICETKQQRI